MRWSRGVDRRRAPGHRRHVCSISSSHRRSRIARLGGNAKRRLWEVREPSQHAQRRLLPTELVRRPHAVLFRVAVVPRAEQRLQEEAEEEQWEGEED